MDINRINYLNIGLMLLSFALAWALPFEFFLFSYAVLGPLHYLTEINWLNQRDYFILRKNDYWILVSLCLIAFLIYLAGFLTHLDIHLPGSTNQFLASRYNNLLVATFTVALAISFVKNMRVRLALVAVSITIAFLVSYSHPYIVLFAAFLPTVIHVWLFTLAFILLGALKANKTSGYLSLAAFLACSVALFLFRRDYLHYSISAYTQESFTQSHFGFINLSLFNILRQPGGGNFALNTSMGLSIQSFIAFAYTYHYLNWFSKTGIIKWHKVSKARLTLSLAAWVASLGLYAYHYMLGLVVLFFLSMLHVFLELPLNYRTLIDIVSQIKVRMLGKPVLALAIPEEKLVQERAVVKRGRKS